MATVANICNRVATVTGWTTTDASAEAVLILEFVNDAYRDACEKTECYTKVSGSISLTSGTYIYTIASAPFSLTDVERIVNVYVTDTAVTEQKLVKVSPDTIRNMRSGITQTTGTVLYYATPKPGEIWFHPTPGTGVTCKVDYVAAPPELVESGAGAGQETTPTAFNGTFHYRILANYAIAQCLDADQRDDSAPWWDRYYQGVEDLAAYVNEYQGRGMQLEHFADTPRRMVSDRSFDY